MNTIKSAVSLTSEKLATAEKTAQISAVSQKNPNPVLQCLGTGQVIYQNQSARNILRKHAIDIYQLLPKEHAKIAEKCLKEQSTIEIFSKIDNRFFEWIYKGDFDDNYLGIYGQDITEQRKVEHQLVHDAMYDSLTGLPNRAMLLGHIKSSIVSLHKQTGYSFAVLVIDINRFKKLMETLGHFFAETVLKKISQRLSAIVKAPDTLARICGDEFCILLEDTKDAEEVAEFAQKACDAISGKIDVHGQRISLTSCIGIAHSTRYCNNAEDMIQNASAALYKAKELGDNQIEVFKEAMHRQALSRLQIHNELEMAIFNNELTVHYQPVFSLKNLRVSGFEALARWKHKDRGFINPSEFIPIAEEGGLILPLGKQILSLACHQLAAWQNEKLPLAWVSVNMSTCQFKMKNLVSETMASINEAGADPRRLFIEITEGTAAESPADAQKLMSSLRNNGLRLALDDFGTGYSSMAYLKTFPIDVLKIDRSFISGLPENQDDAAIATTMINIAKSLGMKIVAEGVENERQAMFLRSIGCHEVQGFLYGKPMVASDATKLLKQKKIR